MPVPKPRPHPSATLKRPEVDARVAVITLESDQGLPNVTVAVTSTGRRIKRAYSQWLTPGGAPAVVFEVLSAALKAVGDATRVAICVEGEGPSAQIPGVQYEPPLHEMGKLLDTARMIARGVVASEAQHSVVRVATDGSVVTRERGGSSIHEGGGAAFMSENGTWGVKYIPEIAVRNSTLAEMHAVKLALRTLSAPRRIQIVSDSQPVIALLTGKGQPRTTSMSGLYKDIQRLMEGREVTFTWVQGHLGNILNEAADRLSRLARQFGVNGEDDSDILRRAAAPVAEGFLTQLAESSSSVADQPS